MKIIRLAMSYIKQAEARVRDAEKAFENNNYPYALRLSQEAVELSLKASLRLIGIEYPKVHDVSDVLRKYIERFPEWYREYLDFLYETSKKLTLKREISFYGGEEALLTPEDLISKDDAYDAVERAKKVLEISKRLLNEYFEHATK